jgi:hypothetical protein
MSLTDVPLVFDVLELSRPSKVLAIPNDVMLPPVAPERSGHFLSIACS